MQQAWHALCVDIMAEVHAWEYYSCSGAKDRYWTVIEELNRIYFPMHDNLFA
jgi:hypothetical protein